MANLQRKKNNKDICNFCKTAYKKRKFKINRTKFKVSLKVNYYILYFFIENYCSL